MRSRSAHAATSSDQTARNPRGGGCSSRMVISTTPFPKKPRASKGGSASPILPPLLSYKTPGTANSEDFSTDTTDETDTTDTTNKTDRTGTTGTTGLREPRESRVETGLRGAGAILQWLRLVLCDSIFHVREPWTKTPYNFNRYLNARARRKLYLYCACVSQSSLKLSTFHFQKYLTINR